MLQGQSILKEPCLPHLCVCGWLVGGRWGGCSAAAVAASARDRRGRDRGRGMREVSGPQSKIKGPLPPRCQHREASHVTAVSQCHRSEGERERQTLRKGRGEERGGETGQCLGPRRTLRDGLSGLGGLEGRDDNSSSRGRSTNAGLRLNEGERGFEE